MEWILANRAAIEVLFAATSLLTVIVVIYLNYRASLMAEMALHESQLAREQEYRPYVYFQIVSDSRTRSVNFRVINRGRHIATNIRLHLDQKLYRNKEKETTVDELAVFQGLSFLAPGGTFEEYVNFTNTFFRSNEDIKVVTGTIRYEDSHGTSYESKIRVPLQALYQRMNFHEVDFHALVESVEDLERTLQRKAMKRR